MQEHCNHYDNRPIIQNLYSVALIHWTYSSRREIKNDKKRKKDYEIDEKKWKKKNHNPIE